MQVQVQAQPAMLFPQPSHCRPASRRAQPAVRGVMPPRCRHRRATVLAEFAAQVVVAQAEPGPRVYPGSPAAPHRPRVHQQPVRRFRASSPGCCQGRALQTPAVPRAPALAECHSPATDWTPIGPPKSFCRPRRRSVSPLWIPFGARTTRVSRRRSMLRSHSKRAGIALAPVLRTRPGRPAPNRFAAATSLAAESATAEARQGIGAVRRPLRIASSRRTRCTLSRPDCAVRARRRGRNRSLVSGRLFRQPVRPGHGLGIGACRNSRLRSAIPESVEAREGAGRPLRSSFRPGARTAIVRFGTTLGSSGGLLHSRWITRCRAGLLAASVPPREQPRRRGVFSLGTGRPRRASGRML